MKKNVAKTRIESLLALLNNCQDAYSVLIRHHRYIILLLLYSTSAICLRYDHIKARRSFQK